MNEAGNGRRGGPRARGGDEMVLQFAEVEVEAVGDGGFEEAAEAFDRIEFGAIRRQWQEPDVDRNTWIATGQMKAGLVGDDHVQGRGIGRGDLLEKERVDVPIDHGG